jgi:hypothetical protein
MNQRMRSSKAVLLVSNLRAARRMAAAVGSPHFSCSHWEVFKLFKDKECISNMMMMDQGSTLGLGTKPARERRRDANRNLVL